MPIITDPDLLADGTDIVVNTTAKTIRILTTGAVDNEGATGGVTGQALYSWLKEEWKSNADYIKFPFPMEAITPEQFEFINGWLPFDDATRKLIRTAGWTERNAGGTVLRQYMGVVSLGSLGATDQPYYRFGTNTATNFTYQGPVNEAVQIFGNADNGNFNFTDGDNFDLYCREQGKTYAYSNNTQIGAPTLTYIVYRFPLSNGTDLNITANDATISTTAPYTSIDIEYFGTDQLFDVNGDSVNEPYRIIIDGATTATTTQIYEKVQYLLRQNVDIDTGAGTVNGRVATSLLSFVGPTLVGANGVYISNLNSNFLNSVDFYDFNGVLRRYPFVAAGTINFGTFAGSGDFIYRMFFTTTPNNNDYGTADALLVNDKDAVAISGTYSGSPVPWTFNYDSNTQGGRTVAPPTDVNVKVVGLGLSGGQFAVVDHVITRTAGQSILLAPAQERNYSNPV
jgi:hypothetical protein